MSEKIPVERNLEIFWDGYYWVDNYTAECFTDEEIDDYIRRCREVNKEGF